MELFSSGVIDGYIEDRFGKRGTQFVQGKKPSYSLPISWSNLPSSTKSLALVFIDHDAIPVCGFSWIHWLVANINPLVIKELPENASITTKLLQGLTSWSSPLLDEQWSLDKQDDIGYGGCAPPDKAHNYTLKLIALDNFLDLDNGFYYNELLQAMTGHILATTSLQAKYKS